MPSASRPDTKPQIRPLQPHFGEHRPRRSAPRRWRSPRRRTVRDPIRDVVARRRGAAPQPPHRACATADPATLVVDPFTGRRSIGLGADICWRREPKGGAQWAGGSAPQDTDVATTATPARPAGLRMLSAQSHGTRELQSERSSGVHVNAAKAGAAQHCGGNPG